MHTFDTRHVAFDGFSEFFDREVQPALVARDSVRAKAVRKGVIFGGISGLVLVGVAVLLFMLVESPIFAVAVIFGAFAIPFGVFAWLTQSIRDETKGRIVGAIVGYVGWAFDADAGDIGYGAFQSLFLLPKKVDRSSFEDGLSGQAHGATFRSVEAHLEKETRDSDGDRKWSTVFRGQLMRLEFPTKTFGRTIVLRDKGWFQSKKKSDMKRIGLVDPVFEKIFEAYGTDQVEGRVILNPDFMQRMVDLEASVSGKNIRFGFDDETLFIAVETADQFEAGSMFKALTSPDRTQKILDEVGAVFDIVDTLLERPMSRRRSV